MRPAFEIKTETREHGDEIRLTRSGPFDYVLAAQINKRLAPLGAKLIKVAGMGWFLRSGADRSSVDANLDPTHTLVLVREQVGAAA